MAKDILSRIVEKKREEVATAGKKLPENELRSLAEKGGGRQSLFSCLKQPGPLGVNIIAEIKRASPSKGPIRADLDPGEYARAYEKGGAAAISVLTDAPFFNGGPADLKAAASASALPILRKDFILYPYQIYEAAVWGADAFLLIVRILSREVLTSLIDVGKALGMDALVEVYHPEDVEMATSAGARLIGINNRNLANFHTDIRTAVRVSAMLGPDQVAVAASGIASREDVDRNLQAGIFNFLVGEHLVRAQDPAMALKALTGAEPS